jgi:hypothetical protein
MYWFNSFQTINCSNLLESIYLKDIDPVPDKYSWFDYSRPNMEWLNPHEAYDWGKYVETLIQNYKIPKLEVIETILM